MDYHVFRRIPYNSEENTDCIMFSTFKRLTFFIESLPTKLKLISETRNFTQIYINEWTFYFLLIASYLHFLGWNKNISMLAYQKKALKTESLFSDSMLFSFSSVASLGGETGEGGRSPDHCPFIACALFTM